MPETMAEKMNTTGINGEFHLGLALMEPKMKPTYPWRMKAEGMPTSVTIHPTLWSMASARGLMLSEPSVITRYSSRFHPLVVWENTTMSRR